jgi:cell division protein FtsB
MSDFGGLGGALMLSDQISTDRLFDSYRRAREAGQLALNDAAWRNHYNNLVGQYNRLLNDANRLADVQDRALNAQERRIAELTAANTSLETEVQRLKLEVITVRNLLALEREAYEYEKTLREQRKGV